jgi:hypothetical protein
MVDEESAGEQYDEYGNGGAQYFAKAVFNRAFAFAVLVVIHATSPSL